LDYNPIFTKRASFRLKTRLAAATQYWFLQQYEMMKFDLFHFIIQKRLKLGRLTVADSTALYDFARRRLLDLAQHAAYHTCLIVFNIPRAVCLQRDQQRPRHVGEAEICTQDALLQEALQQIHSEPWEQIHVLSETDAEVRFIWQTRSQEM
jgi:predicted kinase